jgi:integrase
MLSVPARVRLEYWISFWRVDTSARVRRMMLRVEQGEGRKDRHAMLSPVLLELLRDWYRIARPQGWLLPGQNPVNPMTTRQLIAVSVLSLIAAAEHVHRHHTLRTRRRQSVPPAILVGSQYTPAKSTGELTCL